MSKLFLIPAALVVAVFIACGGGKTVDIEVTFDDTPVAEIAACADTYNEWVEEWDVHVAADDAVSQKYSIWNDGGGFEAWAEDMGYDLDMCD